MKHNNNDDELEDFDLGDIIIYDLARHIEAGGEIQDHYLYTKQSDLFEYEEKINVNPQHLGIDILEKLSDNNGKQK